MVATWQRFASAARRHCLGTITEFRTSQPFAALTFDDGPDAVDTPRVLDVLKRYHARATFFVVGEAAIAAPHVLRQIAAEGHVIGNHTWSHRSVAALGHRESFREIARCAHAIAPYGHRLFRPPWGQQTRASRLAALRLRHRVVAWNVDVADWTHADPATMAAELCTKTRPGSIVLLHDRSRPDPTADSDRICPPRDNMLEALERFLAARHRDFRFLTIPEMLAVAAPVTRLWFSDPRSTLLDSTSLGSKPALTGR